MRPPLTGGPYLVVGLARSGLGASLALRSRGETVFATDPTPAPDVVDALRSAGVEVLDAVGAMGLLPQVLTVVKSPGVPREATLITAALAHRCTVIGELELAWRMLDRELIAVTGTNGKTTTVELLAEMHRAAGLPVAVAGNVGRALSSLILEAPPLPARTTIVCEASSFQLEDTLVFAPDAAVLLNLAPDHLDRHGTLEEYRRAKLRAFAHQRVDDVAVLPAAFAAPGRARRVHFGCGSDCALRLANGSLTWEGEAVLDVSEIRLPGTHNLGNAMAAAAVALARDVPIDAVRCALRTFVGVAHRLEHLATIDGVDYVNDSKATNVASTRVALACFAEGTVHLIAGGQAKEQDFADLRADVAQRARHTYLIGTDASLIAAALDGLPLTLSGTLAAAVAAARERAGAGEVILLSPACASFDQFVDFEDRGNAFRSLL